MRRTTIVLAAVLSIFTWICPAPARAGDEVVVEAVRALLAGAAGEVRDRATEIVRADPEAAVAALLRVTEARAVSGAIVTLGEVPQRRAASPVDRTDPIEGGDEKLVVQIYDVRDLTQGKLTTDALASRLRSLAGDELTVETTESGAMIVRAPSPSHEITRSYLDRLRSKDDATIYEIDTRLIVAPMTATVGAQVMRARAGERVDLDEPVARVEEWLRSGDVQVVASPRVSCLRGQKGSIQVGRRISFVADFDVEVAQSAFIADPVIDVVWDGVTAEFTPWSDSKGQVQLALDVAVSDVELPMATFQSSLGALNEPVTIQIPSYVRTELSRSLEIDDGGSVLVRLADGPDTRRLVLLSVRTVDLVGADESDD